MSDDYAHAVVVQVVTQCTGSERNNILMHWRELDINAATAFFFFLAMPYTHWHKTDVKLLIKVITSVGFLNVPLICLFIVKLGLRQLLAYIIFIWTLLNNNLKKKHF